MFDSAEALEDAYYAAFERGDLDRMLALWTTAADALCIHPEGRILRGPDEVAASWRALLGSGGGLRFERRSLSWSAGDSVAVHTLVEVVSVGGQDRPRGAVLATNAYRMGPAGWEMFLHHASPQPQPLVSADQPPGAVH